MKLTTLQGWLALPLCGLQSLVVGLSLAGDDPIEIADPWLVAGVALAFGIGTFALVVSILDNLFDETIGRERLIVAGLVLMLGLDVWCAIRVAILLTQISPVMACGPIALALLLGGRMVVTGRHLASRLANGGRLLMPSRLERTSR